MMNAKSLLAAAFSGVIGIGQAQAQVVDWTGPNNGNWNLGANWSGGVVPSGPTVTARIDGFDANLFSNGVLPSIGSLELLDNSTLFWDPGANIALSGAASVNNGTIQLNRFGSSVNAVLTIDNAMALTGTGEILMRASSDNAQITGAGLLTQGTMHTIRGVGQISVPMINNNRVAADVTASVSGNDLEIRADVDNNDTMAAVTSSFLEILGGVTVTQSATASLSAEGGTVVLVPDSAVVGGLLETSASGLVTTSGGAAPITLDSVTSLASPFNVFSGSNIDIAGAGYMNDGLTQVNPFGSSANSVVTFVDTGVLGGSGELHMKTSSDNSQLGTGPGMTITHDSAHTIRGVGQIAASMDNAGTVSADVAVSVSGNILELEVNDKTNTGLFSAAGNSVLSIESIALDQTGGGEIRAEDAGVVQFTGPTSVTNGTINSTSTGSVNIRGLAVTTLDTVALNANFFIDPNGTLDVAAGGIVNEGTITLNPSGSSANSILTVDQSTAIGGAGTVRMRTSADNSQINTTSGATLTHGANHRIRGVGQINASLVNNGIIRADVADSVSGNVLELQGEDKINNNLISCEPNTFLDIDGITITQDPFALIVSDTGVIQIKSDARIEDGFINTTNGGVFRTISGSSSSMSSVVSAGTIQIDPNTTITIDAAGLTNNGLIELNRSGSSANSFLNLADATIDGIGEIQMRTSSSNSFISTDPGTTGTLGADQLVRGVGQITGAITNNGEIRADVSISVSGNSLELLTEDKVNSGELIAATGSFLEINGVTVDQSAGGMIIADGGTVVLEQDATIDGGFVGSINGGVWGTFTGGFNVDGALLSGEGVINAGHTMDVLGGSLFNNADIQVNPQFSGADGVIAFDQATTFSGTGSIDLIPSGGNSRISSTAEGLVTLTNGAGHTITGNGEIQVPLVNEGIILPGRPNGSLEATEGATFNAGGEFIAQLNTTGFLNVTGDATLGGTLDIQLTTMPLANGNDKVVLTADSVIGEFDTVNILTDGQLVTRVIYEPTQVTVRTRCKADTNLDGQVNPADFNAWIVAFNTQTSPADQNLDGIISPADFNAWIINFNQGCP